MKKRKEKLNLPPPEAPRPVPQPEMEQQSAADFAKHLAELFREELGEETSFAPAVQPEPAAAEPEAALSAAEPEPAEAPAVSAPEPALPAEAPFAPPEPETPAEPEPAAESATLTESETPAAEPEAPAAEPETLMEPETLAEPAAPTGPAPDLRTETLVSRPVPVPKKLSAELLEEPTKTVLPVFDDRPFAPPPKDPTLEELFGPLEPEAAARAVPSEPIEPPEPKAVPEAAPTSEAAFPAAELPTEPEQPAAASPAEPEPAPLSGETAEPNRAPEAPSLPGKLRGWLRGVAASLRQIAKSPENDEDLDAPEPERPAAESEAFPPETTESAAEAEPLSDRTEASVEASPFPDLTEPPAETELLPDRTEPPAETEPLPNLTEPPAEEAPSPTPETPDELGSEPSDEGSHVPELWDPHSLFSEPEDEDPPPLTPLSRDTTGSLPSLEELFGPISEPAPNPEPDPALRSRPKKKSGWLRNLWSGLAARLAPDQEEEADPDLPEMPDTDPAEILAQPEVVALFSNPEVAAALSTPEIGSSGEAAPQAAPAEQTSAPDAPEAAAEAAMTHPSAEPEPEKAPAEAASAEAAQEPEPSETPLRSETAPEPEPSETPERADAAPKAEADLSAGETDDWDPLALFGSQAADAELPTWEEYLRASKAAQTAAAPAAAPAEAESPAAPSRGESGESAPAPAPIPDGTGEAKAVQTAPAAEKPAAEPPAAPAVEPGPDAAPSIDSMEALDAYLAELGIPVEPENPAPEGPAAGASDTAPGPDPSELPAAKEAASAPQEQPPKPKGSALTLEDFLAAAVPMEETKAPGQKEPPEGKLPRRKKAAAETISTVPENPDGLILARSGRPEGKADADQKAKAEARKQAREPAAPVPSADVRPASFRLRRPAPQPEPEPEPEEPAILYPEEAYRIYAKPLDSIGSNLILTGLFTLLSLFFTLYLSQHWTFLPEIFSGGTTVYILLALLLAMVAVNRKLYFRQWRNEYGLRPELLIGVATLFTALDCFSPARTLRPPFTVVVGAPLLVALWGRYDRGLGLITTIKVLRAERLSAGVSEVQDITKGSRGLIRTEPDVDQFMSKLETRDLTDRTLRVYTPIALGVGLALTLAISIWLKRSFLWTGALVFLGSVPVTGLLAFPRLFCLLAGRLAEAEAALCGYHGAEVFGGEHSILIGDEDIFPAGSLTLNGFKVYNGNPDRVIAYAAAACRSSGSALDPVFEDLLVTHNGRHYTVDNFRFYDSGGIGASIQQDVVLLGSLDFMRRMGVHMDRGARVKQAVYMSLNGELAAVFAIRYAPPENLRRGLAAIAGNRHFKGILVTRTFLGTPGFLKAKFGIPTSAFHYPSTKERIRLSEAEMKRSGAQGAILAQDSFSGFAQAAAGGRMLRSATLGAAILTVLGGLVGLGLMAILAALPATETATALNLLLYAAAWLAPTLLLTAWGRHF